MLVVHSKIFQHPRCQPANPERIRLFDRILLFESTLYVLIKSRLRDELDYLHNFFAPFLNPFAASKQNIDFEYLFRFDLPIIALPKIKVKTSYEFFCVLNYSFFFIKIGRQSWFGNWHIYNFCSIFNGFWSRSKKFDMPVC